MGAARSCGAAVAALGLAVTLSSVATADTCQPARTSQDLSELDADWSSALRSLVDATRQADQPWGCPEATLRLDVLEDGAELRVERTARAPISRHLSHPEDLVTTGKAMLARTLPPAAPIDPIVERPPVPADDEDSASFDPTDGRAYIQATGVVRYAGVSDVLALGAAGRGTIPIGDWSVMFGARYVTLAADVGTRRAEVQEFDYDELTIEGGFGYALLRRPVLLRVGVFGTLAVVDMDIELPPTATAEVDVESGAIDGRLGTELRLSVPLWGPLLFATSVDAEVAPASLVNTDRRIKPELPPMPGYTIGTDFGLEIVIP